LTPVAPSGGGVKWKGTVEPVNLFVEPFLCGTFLEPGAKYRVELLCTTILGMLLSNVNGGIAAGLAARWPQCNLHQAS
jgi:hypothetical protein